MVSVFFINIVEWYAKLKPGRRSWRLNGKRNCLSGSCVNFFF